MYKQMGKKILILSVTKKHHMVSVVLILLYAVFQLWLGSRSCRMGRISIHLSDLPSSLTVLWLVLRLGWLALMPGCLALRPGLGVIGPGRLPKKKEGTERPVAKRHDIVSGTLAPLYWAAAPIRYQVL